jgi:hypothetical protein
MVPFSWGSASMVVAMIVLVATSSSAEGGAAIRRSAHHVGHLQAHQAVADALPVSAKWDELQTQVAAVLDADGLKHNETGVDADKQPGSGLVTVQVAEQDIKNLKEKLTPKCGDRFSAQVDGKGPKMHRFQSNGDTKEDAKKCQNLEGHLCRTEVKMRDNSTQTDSRRVVKTLTVQGNSCMPAECSSQKDLDALARFKLGLVKNLVTDHNMVLNLHIDCAGAGGGVAKCGGAGPDTSCEPQAKSRAAYAAPTAIAGVAIVTALGFA